MKKLFPALLAALCSVFILSGATPQWYEARWAEIRDLETDQKYASALKVANDIYTEGIEDSRYVEVLGALDKTLYLKAKIDWNYSIEMPDSMRRLGHIFHGPLPRAAYYLKMAQWLDNTYIGGESKDTTDYFYALPLNQWSESQKCKAILHYIGLALASADSIGNDSPGDYAKLFDFKKEQSFPSKNISVWARRAAIASVKINIWKYEAIFKPLTDELLSSVADDPYLYTAIYMSDSRITRESIDSIYMMKMDSLIARFPGHPATVWPMTQKLDRNITRRNRIKWEKTGYIAIDHRLARLIDSFPDSKFIEKTKALKTKINEPSGSMYLPSQLYPGKKTSINISHCNIDRLDIDIYRLADSVDISNEKGINRETIKAITKRIKPVQQQKIDLEAKLYIEKTTPTELTVTNPGKYLFVCRDKKDTILAARYFSVSRVGALYRNTPRGVEVYAADFETGEPFADFDVEMKNTGTQENFTRRIKTAGFSTTLSPVMTEEDKNWTFTATKGNDIYCAPLNMQIYKRSSYKEDNNIRTRIYTDRKRYASRDTVFFKAYSYEVSDSGSRVCPGIDNWFFFYGPDSEHLATSTELTSDEFGGYGGYFVLDGSHISGTYHLGDKTYKYLTSIIVGDFKLPTLTGDIKPEKEEYSFGDRVVLKGNVSSFAGFPADSVSVRYNVERSSNWRFCLGSHSSYNGVILESETLTDAYGNFTIAFDANKPQEIKDDKTSFKYTVTATITDKRGETLELRKFIDIGEYKYRFAWDLPRYIDKASGLQPVIEAYNTLENKVTGVRGRYEIKDYKSKTTILEGTFINGQPMEIEWEKLECKNYTIVITSEISAPITRSFTIYDDRSTTMPEGSDMLFITPKTECDAGEPVKFMFGTTAQKQYATVELFCGDSLLSARNMVFEKGLIKYSVPYPDEFPDEVCLVITTICNGNFKSFQEYYKRETDLPKKITLKIVSLRETSTPGAQETISFETRDENGKGIASSVLVSIYDKATDDRDKNNFYNLYIRNDQKGTYFNKSSQCFKFEYLRLSFKSNNLSTAKIASLDIIDDYNYGSSSSINDNSAVNIMIGGPQIKENSERKNFRRTAAFITNLVTDSSGYAKARFTLPDALTTYRVLALAVAKDARSATTEASIVAKKELMVITNYPQYLRSGDRVELRFQARNLTDKELRATLTLRAEGSKDDKTETFRLRLVANSSETVSWIIDVPDNANEIRFTADLDGKTHRDIEKRSVPVIPAIERFASGDSRLMTGDDNITIDLSKYLRPGAENEKLNIRVGAAKSVIISSLPLAMATNPKSLIDILDNWYINGVGRIIGRSYGRIINGWHDDEVKAGIIEKNAPITGIAASETPWRQTGSMLDRSKALLDMSNFNASIERSKKTVDIFSTYQNNDGGYPWFRGMPSSVPMTMLLLDRYNALFECGYFTGVERYSFYSGAVNYLDKQMLSIYENSSKYERLPYEVIDYLYVRSPLMRYPFVKEEYREMWDYFVGRAKQEWRKYEIAEIAKVATALKRIDTNCDIDAYLATLAEFAVKGKTYGTYFPNAVMPFRGMIESEMRAHAIMLRLFDTSERYADLAEGIACWLMSQRKNQQWENSTATADVVWAIVNHYNILETKDSFKRGTYGFHVDRQFVLADTPLRGYDINTKAIRDGNLKTVNISTQGPGACFVDITYSCDIPIAKAEAQSNGFKVVRTLFRNKNGKEERIDENTMLHPGDELIARYYIKNDENRSFVVLKALRSGALEPIDNISQYSYQGYYREVKESHTNYFFYTMPEGDNFVEERFRVWYAGSFNDGLIKINSLVAPAYGGNTASGILTVTP